MDSRCTDLIGYYYNMTLKKKRRWCKTGTAVSTNGIPIPTLSMIATENEAENQNFVTVLVRELLASRPISTRVYSLPKPNANYWERVLESWNEQQYHENLRLRKDTFMNLCHELRGDVVKLTTNYKEPVTVECRIAICLWRIASGTSYREISKIFGLGKATVFQITIEVCTVISRKLLPKYVTWPPIASAYSASLGFSMNHNLPNCIGAIDGCHIPIPKPIVDGEDYYNRKGRYSINIQAVVNHRGRFLDVVIGWPGKVHDARVLRNSELYKKATDGTLFPQSDLILDGVKIPFYIIGDAAYPLKPWLMKPYSRCTGSAETHFNYKLSQARMAVERAFGRLKARWRCLLRCCDACPANARVIIASCIVMHNFCEMRGDRLAEATDIDCQVVSREIDGDDDTNESGEIVQNALRDFLNVLRN